jgi:hypothetical protein
MSIASNINCKMYLPRNPRISVDPPCSPNTTLPIKDAELIKPKLVFQPARHGDARCASPDNKNRIVRIGIAIVAIDSSNSFTHREASQCSCGRGTVLNEGRKLHSKGAPSGSLGGPPLCGEEPYERGIVSLMIKRDEPCLISILKD